MEIVPTSLNKKKELGLDFLIIRKTELKQEIVDQKKLISVRTQNLFTPASYTTYLSGSLNKGLNILDAFLLGFKIVKSIKSIFRKFS
jgi:uncharacterized NAD-dependent epimerase/dehydratase family protein